VLHWAWPQALRPGQAGPVQAVLTACKGLGPGFGFYEARAHGLPKGYQQVSSKSITNKLITAVCKTNGNSHYFRSGSMHISAM
jgi:hypothetical protein